MYIFLVLEVNEDKTNNEQISSEIITFLDTQNNKWVNPFNNNFVIEINSENERSELLSFISDLSNNKKAGSFKFIMSPIMLSSLSGIVLKKTIPRLMEIMGENNQQL